jgi:hypothetical protein
MMANKTYCPFCNLEFSRQWNMKRHINTIHNLQGNLNNIMQLARHNTNPPYGQLPVNQQNSVRHQLNETADDWLFPGMSRLQNTMKRFAELANNMPRPANFIPPDLTELQQRLNSVTSELSYLKSNFSNIPKEQIHGISGYFCKRCQSFTSYFVRDPGYDMTAEGKHICDENKVKSIWAVAIRQSDTVSKNNFCAGVLLNQVNLLIPDTKFLKVLDFTNIYSRLLVAFNSDFAKSLIGIPDRFSLFTCNESSVPRWLNRGLSVLDKIAILTEQEISDFLGTLKSSYAMIEILSEKSPRLIFLSLVV